MLRSLPHRSWLALLCVLPNCLVSFNDYPLGDLDNRPGGGADSALGGTNGAGATSSSAGRGGESNTAGNAGTDDGDAGGAPPASDGPSLIDDFEDGDADILPNESRRGAWYAGNDGTGMQTPRADQPLLPSLLNPAREGSTRAVHSFGGPFSSWGALIGTSLAATGGPALPYDLSRHTGVRLWVRAGTPSPSLAKQVRLNFPTAATSPGGSCSVCGDHFGAEIPLTTKWTQFEVPFATVKQQGYGTPRLMRLDLTRVTSVQLMFPKNVSFDLWLDDIELY